MTMVITTNTSYFINVVTTKLCFQFPSCAPNWSSMDKFSLFYNWYLMTFGFFVPTSVVIVSNILVFNKSRKVLDMIRHLKCTNDEVFIFQFVNFELYLIFNQRTNKAIIRKKESVKGRRPKTKDQPVSDSIRKEAKMQRKLTLLSTLMTFAFYLSWMPYALVCLIVMGGVNIPRRYQMFASLFAKSGTLVNPILYIFFNKDVSFCNHF